MNENDPSSQHKLLNAKNQMKKINFDFSKIILGEEQQNAYLRKIMQI